MTRARHVVAEWYLFVLVVAALTLLAMSWYLYNASADAMLYALISTQRMTLFYWGQDRLVSLLPALAFPVRDPLWNFYVQMAIQGASFFALVGLVARFHLTETGRASDRGTVAGTAFAAGLLTTMVLTNEANYWLIFEQQYASSLLLFILGVAGSMSRDLRRQITAVPLVVLSVLIIPSTVLFAPAAWVLGEPATRRRRFAITLGIVLAAFVINKFATIVSADNSGRSGLYMDFSVTRFTDGVATAFENFKRIVDGKIFWLFVLQSGFLLIIRRRSLTHNLRLVYGCSAFFALGWFMLFTANGWVESMGFHPRYYFPVFGAVIVVTAGAIAEVVRLLADGVPKPRPLATAHRRTLAVLVAGLATMSLGAFHLLRDDGIPALAQGFGDVNATRSLDVDFVAGSYWRVWPIVLVARSQDLDVYGITQRSETIRDEIRREAERRSPELTVMCVDVDAATCVSDFSTFVGEEWEIVTIRHDVPLVLGIEPVRPP